MAIVYDYIALCTCSQWRENYGILAWILSGFQVDFSQITTEKFPVGISFGRGWPFSALPEIPIPSSELLCVP